MNKLFAIGDVHGCEAKLLDLMRILPIDHEGDTLVFIGDYIDRGPAPKGVVDTLLEIRERYHHVVYLLGNHEQMLLDYLQDRNHEDLFLANGGGSTIASYGLVKKSGKYQINVPEDHLHFFNTLVPFHETEAFIFAHAGLRPGIPLDRQHLDDLLWIRQEFYRSSYHFEKPVVFGHTPFSAPLIEPSKIGIDTGAVYGGKLTCIELTEMRTYQV